VLRANSCQALRSVVLQLPASSVLEDVSLADCRCLTDLVITSPTIADLNVSGCVNLTLMALQCPRLARLRASGCTGLVIGAGEMPFECPQLRYANFFGCRSFDSSSFEAAMASFTALEELDLCGCSALGRLVASGSCEYPSLGCLRRLIVDGCALLRHLKLNSPVLEFLSAKSCIRLMVCMYVPSHPVTLPEQQVHLPNDVCGNLVDF